MSQKVNIGLFAAGCALLAGGCSKETSLSKNPNAHTAPAHVEIRKIDERYQMFVNDQPFYIKGAGLEFGSPEKLTAHGGNAFRTWRLENGRNTAREVLDRAQSNGLYVAMCIDISGRDMASITTTRTPSPANWRRWKRMSGNTGTTLPFYFGSSATN